MIEVIVKFTFPDQDATDDEVGLALIEEIELLITTGEVELMSVNTVN